MIICPQSVAIDRAIVEKGGLYQFVKTAWHEVEPSVEYVDGRHIKLICRYLELLARFKITRLIINIPPSFSKSLLTSVFMPAWAWIEQPDLRILGSSHDETLALRDAGKCKDLIESDWYQARWGDKCRILRSKNKSDAVGFFNTTGGGFRLSTTIGGRAVGWHFHIQMVDDPTKPLDAESSSLAALTRVRNWWTGTMSTRKLDPRRFARLITMQRVHMYDLSGVSLDAGGWTHLCLPIQYMPDHPCVSPDDWRTEPGELLCPERFGSEDVAELRRSLGPHHAGAQLDQLPEPPGGAVFRHEWLINFWTDLESKDLRMIQSWDHTFGSQAKTASYTVGQVWGQLGQNAYLIDQRRDRCNFPEMLTKLRILSTIYPRAHEKVIEKQAAGPQVQQQLENEIHGMILAPADRSTGGKLARAQSTTSIWAASRVYLPHPTDARLDGRPHPCPWVLELIDRHLRFTGADADVADEIDASSQALLHLFGSAASRFARTMADAKREIGRKA